MGLANVIAPPLQVKKTALTPGDYTLSLNEVRIYGDVVTICVACNANITPASSGWVVLGSIPEEIKPLMDFDFAGINNRDDSSIHLRITSSLLIFYGFAGQGYNPYFTITYIRGT